MNEKTVFSAEHIRKLSEARKGKKHSEETKAKMRATWARKKALKVEAELTRKPRILAIYRANDTWLDPHIENFTDSPRATVRLLQTPVDADYGEQEEITVSIAIYEGMADGEILHWLEGQIIEGFENGFIQNSGIDRCNESK